MSSKAKLTVLRCTRGRLKCSLTKQASFTESIVDTVSMEILEVRMEKVNELWEEFKTSQNSMYEFHDQEGYIDPDPEFEDFESKYLTVKSILLAAIRERSSAYRLAQQQAVLADRRNNPPESASSHRVDTFLPQIRIEPFSGSYRDWPTFRDMFVGAVHNRTHLTPTQKFHFLKSYLRGEALNLLSHITISDATYTQAWERLEGRYNRPRYIISNFIKIFFDLPTTNLSNVSILRKISNGADEVVRGLSSIKSLNRDPWLIYLLLNKVDGETRQAWSEFSVEENYPSIEKFLTFLERRCEALENGSCSPVRQTIKARNTVVRSSHASSLSSSNCPKCGGSHVLPQCTEFLALTIQGKRDFVKSNKLCFNCLRGGHTSARCSSKHRCRTCNTRHHSLVHLDTTTSSQPYTIPENALLEKQEAHSSPSNSYQTLSKLSSDRHVSTHHSIRELHCPPQILLPTAVGKVLDSRGNYQRVRLLLDSGSEVSFVSESCVQRLGLKRQNARVFINGIGSTSAGRTRGLISMCINSCFETESISVDAYVLPQVTSNLPTVSFNVNTLHNLKDLDLADPCFNKSGSIDILLGADKVWELLRVELRYGEGGYPIAQKTIFGWVLAGRSIDSESQIVRSHNCTLNVDEILQAFWNIEEVNPKSLLTEEERNIEDHFLKTHSRDSSGKYIVHLPFKAQPQFSGTISGAINRLNSMEKKFQKNEDLRKEYSRFLDEYCSLGHMSQVAEENIAKENVYYLPHHAVLKPESTSTKLRVVFDGSFKDAKGRSLNECLMVGPSIQRNLFSVCLRFRKYNFVFTADIIKMFRQIWISETDRDFLRIVWRKSPNDPLEHFKLCTVTYGTSCAPFQSIRVLQQLAQDYRDELPLAAEIIENDFYVDDVVSDADSLEDAIFKKKSLMELLSKGGFELSKWQSNCKELLQNPHAEQNEYAFLESNGELWKKVLGLNFNSLADTFSFRLNLGTLERVTKRHILRDIASIFDPLGFLGPCVILFKIIFQGLWHKKLDWDDEVPHSISSQWLKYRGELSLLTELAIPRYIGLSNNSLQLHGFSDASTAAYAAVIYSRYQLPNGQFETQIVASKTPLKQLSIPRLELCAALLLARLLEAVQRSLMVKFGNIYAWTDSTVVLSWLSSPSRRWNTFVGNRTAEILNTIPRNRWYHVKSMSNPADCASRGVPPSGLMEHPIWWSGPNWLQGTEDNWPVVIEAREDLECLKEENAKIKQSLLVVTSDHPFEALATSCSSWNKLIKSAAFVLRFISNSRHQTQIYSRHLKTEEIRLAKLKLIQYLQAEHFGKSIHHHKRFGNFPNKCNILSLNPFLDNDNILRVGGRIEQANVAYNTKHPIIIPKEHRITKLILLDAHHKYLHPGVSTLFAIIRQEYWIIGCRNLLRKISHECITCFKHRKITANQLMGNLPPPRITQSRPFSHSGCDYAGPIAIKTKTGRKSFITKGYISLFVCLSTKAIHLELVSVLSTDAFLAALRRFVARRGKPSHMYSDNGTNFRGAARELSEMHNLLLSEHHHSLLEEALAKDGITWHFIPPSAPHFGGLWEAGIKSVKYHLRRVIGEDILTFEELYTLLTQIEAILNSRPLCQMSDNDIDVLTPAHFLLGEPLSIVPEPTLDIPTNGLSSWQSIQAKVQGYWKRWSMEYITSLQNRPKWQQPQQDFKVDDLVLNKEPNLPPGKWVMGRVTNTHPGKDAQVRVVSLRTPNGNFLRPIQKLARLPLC